MKFQFWKGMDTEAWRFLLKKNEISYFDMFNSIIGYKSVTYKTCSVTRVTRLASQTQLSIVLHRKVLGCEFSMWLSGIVIVVLAGENAFSFHHEIYFE